MRKPVFPRIILLVFIYLAAFTVLVSIQFSKPEGTTRRTGGIAVSGQYRQLPEDDPSYVPDEYILEGNVFVSFGGIDFYVTTGGESLPYIIRKDGEREEAYPDRLYILENSILFLYPDGNTLSFSAYDSRELPEMRIIAELNDDAEGIELPFKPQRRTGIQNAGNGQFISKSGRINYIFYQSNMDAGKKTLLVEAGGRPASYRAIPDSKALSPEGFILPQAETAESYGAALKQWRDENFTLWNRIVSMTGSEDVVVALLTEAIARGSYGAAVASIPQAFTGSSARTYEPSVYFGNLDQASRLLAASERDKSASIQRLINDKSLEFLLESHVIEYLVLRGQDSLLNTACDLVNSIDLSILALDLIPGIFEGCLDFGKMLPGAENPFERIIDEASQIVFQSLQKAEAGIYISFGGVEQTEFNLRLGNALLAYGEASQNATLAGIGRSLVLSALLMGNEADAKPDSAKLYRILNPLDVYPRSLPVRAGTTSAWAWTTASKLDAVQQNDILDIAVTFPAGQTHYMIIRGIRTFSRIQLYNMDFRTDPQFERYDSSGWSYIQQEQTLIVKMKHRENIEHIRIIFREAPRPVVVPEVETENESTESSSDNPVLNNSSPETNYNSY